MLHAPSWSKKTLASVEYIELLVMHVLAVSLTCCRPSRLPAALLQQQSSLVHCRHHQHRAPRACTIRAPPDFGR